MFYYRTKWCFRLYVGYSTLELGEKKLSDLK